MVVLAGGPTLWYGKLCELGQCCTSAKWGPVGPCCLAGTSGSRPPLYFKYYKWWADANLHKGPFHSGRDHITAVAPFWAAVVFEALSCCGPTPIYRRDLLMSAETAVAMLLEQFRFGWLCIVAEPNCTPCKISESLLLLW